MKRNILCVILALTLLFSVSCGSTTPAGSTSADSSSSAAASGSAAGSGATSGETSDPTTPSGDEVAKFEYLNYSMGLLDNGYYEGITAQDYVTLPETLTGIQIPADVHTVDEVAVQQEAASMMDQFSDYEKIYDRAVVNGDQVNIDYVGRVDGVAFDGGNTNGQGTVVTAGSEQYIDDFLTQIIGAKPGDTVMVEVTFPTPYENNPDLAGKEAVFETVINYIQGDFVIVDLTDANVEKYLKDSRGYTTVEDVCKEIREMQKYDQMRAYLLEWLEKQCSFKEIPESILADQKEMFRIEMNNTASQYGLSLNAYLTYNGFSSVQEMYDTYAADTEYTVRLYMMCQAVAEKVGFEVTKADTDAYFLDFLKLPSYEVYSVFYGLGYINQDVLAHLVTMYLMENASMA